MGVLVRPLVFIALALAGLFGLLAFQFGPIVAFFAENLVINSMILAVFALGIALSFWRLMSLAYEIRWLGRIRVATQATDADTLAGPGIVARLHMLASFANVWRRFFDSSHSLTPDLATSLVESAQTRLDERRELSRFLTNALLILGLLGTFWGLLGALIGMREALGNLDAGQDFFAGLSGSLSRPLESMGTAFSSTLFGLAASLLFGFIELQTTRAHSTFLEDFEAWLATFVQAGASIPDQVPTISQTRPSMAITHDVNFEFLGHLMRRGQYDTMVLNNNLVTLVDQLTRIADKMTADQAIHEKILASHADQRHLIDQLNEVIAALNASLSKTEVSASNETDDGSAADTSIAPDEEPSKPSGKTTDTSKKED